MTTTIEALRHTRELERLRRTRDTLMERLRRELAAGLPHGFAARVSRPADGHLRCRVCQVPVHADGSPMEGSAG